MKTSLSIIVYNFDDSKVTRNTPTNKMATNNKPQILRFNKKSFSNVNDRQVVLSMCLQTN